ncbi:MAG: MgtC/SapB family protein [Corallococcus sp.]|nr:MgtC/SapB family protein [Corallococcus sp.]
MFDKLFPYWSMELICLARIVFAGLLGIVLGFERMLREKEAGIRTHFVVAVGSALLMVLSKYAFEDVEGNIDKARIAAQVVSGIGFLGAGMIIYRRESLHGLTTAAGVWLTAGIGMAAGAGLYILALGGCIVTIIVQTLLHLNGKRKLPNRHNLISVRFFYDEDTVKYLKNMFDVTAFMRFKATENGERIVVEAVVRTMHNCSAEQLAKILMENKNIISIERINDN